MHQILPPLVFLVCLLAAPLSQALTVDGNYHALNSEFEYLEDPEGKLTIEDLLNHPAQYEFKSGRDGKPTAAFVPTWLKVQLDFNENVLDSRYFLFGRLENLFDIRLYRPDGRGGYSERVTGNDHPASSRELDTLRYGFAIEPDAQPYTLYLRVVGGPGNQNLPWDLVEEHTYHTNSLSYYSLNVAALSGIAALLFFNLVIALSLRRADYLYYSAYVFSVMMALLTLDGVGFYYFWPDTPVLNERALHTFNLLSASLRLLAILSFLEIARLAPRLYLASKWVLGLLVVALTAVNVVGVTKLPAYAATVPWAIGILFGFLVCGYAIRERLRLAWPLFITLLVPSIAAVAQALLTVSSDEIGLLTLHLAKIGFAIHVMMFSLCLAAHIKIETESHRDALHDSLTGLPGTRLLAERFDWAAIMSRRHNWKMGVLFIDLDGFKAVNDTLGHAGGDQLLTQVAARMQGALRRNDFVARMGGDEFVALLIELKKESSIAAVAEKLLATLATPYRIDSREVRISASIGIAIFPDQAEDLPDLLKAADAAMYTAKSRGKNAFALAT